MKTLYVLADLGRVRAIELTRDSELAGGRRHLAELPSAAWEQARPPLGETVTDQAGRFAQGQMTGLAGGMSYGEEHELEAEEERRAIEAVAVHIDGVVAGAGHPGWILAAPKSILKTLEAALSDASRRAIRETVAADLTKTPLSDLEERFLG